MSKLENVSRRSFLKGIGLSSGALVLAYHVPSAAKSVIERALNGGSHVLTHFVSIAEDGLVTLVCHRMEMGQGILTSVPQIIADEMEADWSQVKVVLGEADPSFGPQGTGGSESIRGHFPYLRQLGAAARQMLEQAAAEKWKVSISEVKAQDHHVIHSKSGKKLGYGELAQSASKLEAPALDKVKVKSPSEFKLIGKNVKLAGQEDIVQGKAVYAQDVELPGMLIASIERPPVLLGKVKSFDATEAKKVKGVVDVVQLKDRGSPVNVLPVSGVAVLATNTWAALQGRKKLKIEWDHGDNEKENTTKLMQDLVAQSKTPGEKLRVKGDVYNHKYDPDKTVEASYTMPFHHHMQMEPPAATAWKDGDTWKIWTGTQSPQWAENIVRNELGLKDNPEKVKLYTTLMGGAFGRKGKSDFVVEAIELAKTTDRPVKVIWSREDDVQHGFYHSIAANYYKAEITDKGKADYWIQRVAQPPINWIWSGKPDIPSGGAAFQLSMNLAEIPFTPDNMSSEMHTAAPHLRLGWLRAVHNLNNAFAFSSFVDELAVKAKIPTRQMWLNMLGEDRSLDLRKEGFDRWTNYGKDLDDKAYAVTTKRMKDVLNLIADKAGVEEKLPKGEGWGISVAYSFNSYAAAATKVRVKGKKLEVLEMHCAIDCGTMITPDRVESQMEGAMIMGLSLALFGGITTKDGAVEQSNFHDYQVPRISQVPDLHVHLVESTEAPGGVGEPGLPPIVPSITNAIYHASGIRVRNLPVSDSLTI